MGSSIVFNNLKPGIEVKTGVNTIQSYKVHLHQELSIGLVIEGETTVTVNGVNIDLNKGDGILIPAYLSHLCEPFDIEHWNFYMIYIDKSIYKNFYEFKEVRKLNLNELNVYKILIEYISQGTDIFSIENTLIELLEMLAKKLSLEKSKESSCVIKRYEDATSVYNYIKKNFTKELNLDEISDRFDINKYTLIRKFKTKYNTTPSAFQLQLKVAKAKEMIKSGVDVQDIIYTLHFYDQAHLIHEFKKMNGVTPSEYFVGIQ